MVIVNDTELNKATARLRELQAKLAHTAPGKYPDNERECIEVFNAIEAYYTLKGDI